MPIVHGSNGKFVGGSAQSRGISNAKILNRFTGASTRGPLVTRLRNVLNARSSKDDPYRTKRAAKVFAGVMRKHGLYLD